MLAKSFNINSNDHEDVHPLFGILLHVPSQSELTDSQSSLRCNRLRSTSVKAEFPSLEVVCCVFFRTDNTIYAVLNDQ